MGRTSVLVVGGGCSGTLAAVHLLRDTDHRVVLVEAGPAPGPGLAYATTNPAHLLNSRAGTMSVGGARPHDFTVWCRERDPAMSAQSFAPRTWYGSYLQERLADAAAGAPGRLEVHSGRIRSLRLRRGHPPAAAGANGEHWTADRVVIAAGHAPPGDPSWAAALRGHPGYVADPWRAGALDRVPVGPVLLLGTGLTAIDVALTLQDRGPDLVAMSRHGLLPQAHVDGAPPPDGASADVPPYDGLAPLMRHVRRAATAGPDWRVTVDALRPAADDIWQRLSTPSRERFLRHAARHWEVHRHRMAPAVAARVAGLTSQGRLRVRAGRVRSAEPAPHGITLTVERGGGTERLAVAAVVNCTGPGSPLRHPLVGGLLVAGAARGGPLGLGLDVDPTGRLLDDDGRAWPDVFLLGPARRGRLWETTAVPEIRAQAERLALAA